MELVEGEDLSQRIARGAIPIDEARLIAKQIAEALEAAHEQGIIHRDLKPANIKVRPDGTVKVLDFGLAKALEPTGAMSPGISQAPTVTAPAMTQAGVILGTAAYMSPEQARGRPVDKRSDIWAFGCVLYEMLTGRRAFHGEDVAQTLAYVLEREPDWSRLPAGLPSVLASFLRRCFHRQPKQRVGDVQDLRLALDGAFETAKGAGPMASASSSKAWRLIPAAVAGVMLVVAGGFAVWSARRSAEPAPRPVTRLAIEVPSLGDHALGPVVPLQWVAFWASDQLRKISSDSGVSVPIGTSTVPFGANWGPDGTLLINEADKGISRVPASGGTPEVVVPVGENEVGLASPNSSRTGSGCCSGRFPADRSPSSRC